VSIHIDSVALKLIKYADNSG